MIGDSLGLETLNGQVDLYEKVVKTTSSGIMR